MRDSTGALGQQVFLNKDFSVASEGLSIKDLKWNLDQHELPWGPE